MNLMPRADLEAFCGRPIACYREGNIFHYFSGDKEVGQLDIGPYLDKVKKTDSYANFFDAEVEFVKGLS
jgi:hypothetical protein